MTIQTLKCWLFTQSNRLLNLKLKEHQVKLVITTTSGWDHIDVQYLHSQGIKVVRMPLLRRDAVVESIVAMLLELNRRHQYFRIDASRNEWTRGQLLSINQSVFKIKGLRLLVWVLLVPNSRSY